MSSPADVSVPEASARLAWALPATAGVFVVAWALFIFTVPELRFVIVTPKAKTGFEASLGFLRLFTALVLFMFPDERSRLRLRWVALGFVIQGVGGLGFGYLLPLAHSQQNVNAAMYGSLLSRALGTLATAVGLAPRRPPPLARSTAALLVSLFAEVGLVAYLIADHLPPLADVSSLNVAAAGSSSILRGLTAWHWTFSTVPIVASVAAAVGAVRHYPGRAPTGWLALAMVFMAGSQLHTLFWPSAYSSIYTTASLLRLAFTVIAVIGAVLELNRASTERAALLAIERAYASRLNDLARVRADFTAMVAHELVSPLAAIQRAAELMTVDPLSPRQDRAVATIERETSFLHGLVADVQLSAAVEGEDFSIQPRPIELSALPAAAVNFAENLPGTHPVICENGESGCVLADPERIGQVLRNLLSNAAANAPSETPITLRARRAGDRFRVEVADCGPGVHEDDQNRIFEKYERGRSPRSAGAGLGLFLSRKIVQAHGFDLFVSSPPGEGATFWFELEEAS